MMTIKELKKRKKELGYTNEMVARHSGVPLGTVQKIFSGATRNPRIDTLEALEMVLKKPLTHEYSYETESSSTQVNETVSEYAAVSDTSEKDGKKAVGKRVERWNTKREPSERWPKQGQYTIKDLYAIPDDVRVELIDGVIYDQATPNLNHQIIHSELFYEFHKCIREHGKRCKVFSEPFDVRLDRDNRTMVEPDLMIVCEMDAAGTDNHLEGPPDLAVEILSQSTRDTDCTIKLNKYMNAGVREYWIVDPKNEKVMVYVFEEDFLPTQYSFEDTIPIGISGGECSIDFSSIKEQLL